MKTLLTASLLLAPLAMGMTDPDAAAPAATKDVTVGIDLAVGKSSSVILDGNPTTGFTWNVVSVSSDAVKVSTAIMAAKLKKGEPPVCGAPSPTQVTFTGVKPGKSTVVLEYKRTWETEPADRTMTFVVTVSAE